MRTGGCRSPSARRPNRRRPCILAARTEVRPAPKCRSSLPPVLKPWTNRSAQATSRSLAEAAGGVGLFGGVRGRGLRGLPGSALRRSASASIFGPWQAWPQRIGLGDLRCPRARAWRPAVLRLRLGLRLGLVGDLLRLVRFGCLRLGGVAAIRDLRFRRLRRRRPRPSRSGAAGDRAGFRRCGPARSCACRAPPADRRWTVVCGEQELKPGTRSGAGNRARRLALGDGDRGAARGAPSAADPPAKRDPTAGAGPRPWRVSGALAPAQAAQRHGRHATCPARKSAARRMRQRCPAH